MSVRRISFPGDQYFEVEYDKTIKRLVIYEDVEGYSSYLIEHS